MTVKLYYLCRLVDSLFYEEHSVEIFTQDCILNLKISAHKTC